MATRTLSDIDLAMRYEYYLLGMDARHPPAQTYRLLRDTYRELRERLTTEGVTIFLSSVEVATTGSGKSPGVPGTVVSYLDFGITTTQPFTVVTRVDILDGTWRELEHISYDAALNYTDGISVSTTRAWCEYACGEVASGDDLSQGPRILLIPPASSGVKLRITGLSTMSDIVAATPLYLEFGVDQYMMARAAASIAECDGEIDTAQFRLQKAEVIYQSLRKRLKNRTPSPVQRTHTRPSIVGHRRRAWYG